MDMKSHDMTFTDPEKLPARERILVTVIRLIEKEGVHGLTTRVIAREANVNIAAVNYYFGSKQKLIEETLQFALGHMFSDTTDFLAKTGSDRHNLLKNIMFYFLEGSVRYPGLIKAMLHEPINNNNYDDVVMQQIMSFINGLIAQSEKFMHESVEDVRIRLMQIVSVSLMPALLPDMFRMILGDDFTDNSDKQKHYIDKFFEAYWSKVI